MPPLQPVEGVAKVTFHHTLIGVNIVNRIHVWAGTSAAWTQPELDALSAAAFAAWGGNVMVPLNSHLILNECVAQDLSSTGFLSSTHTGSVAGGESSAPDGNNVACCVSLHEPNRYRGGHPRIYLSGISPDNRSDGKTWTSGFQTSVQTKMQAFLTAMTGISLPGGRSTTPGVVHRTLHGAVLTPPRFYSTLTCSVDSRVDSQRRRLGKA